MVRLFFSIANVARYNSTPCLSSHIAAAAQHRFTSFFLEMSNQATLKPPGFENGNRDRPKRGMLIPNMSCTFVQRPHQDLVPFSALQNNDHSCGLLESIHTTTRFIYPNFQGSKMIAFKSSRIIVVMILEPSTGTPAGDGS